MEITTVHLKNLQTLSTVLVRLQSISRARTTPRDVSQKISGERIVGIATWIHTSVCIV